MSWANNLESIQLCCKRRENAAAEIVAGLVFTAIAYFCGWLQLMLVMGISPEAAFLAGVAPFVVVDVLKILAAVACARAVKAAVR